MTGSYLKLYLGPMFSGKSTHLLSEINRYKYITDNILVINHILDKERHKEYETLNLKDGYIKTHDNKVFPAIMLNNLSEIYTNQIFSSKYLNADIVIIDEGQFYIDIYEFLKYELMCNNKTFIVGGLSGDTNMNPIGEIVKLVALADEIHKLTAYCIYCKTPIPASFTKRLESDNDNDNNKNKSNTLLSCTSVRQNIQVGSSEIYSPVCRKHYKN